jgi:hypothetical protein
MHPFISQSIAAERVRDLQNSAKHNRDAALARDRHSRRGQAPRTSGPVRLLPARLRLHTS